MRIAVGGIAIESCTWSPVPTDHADFQILRGTALVNHYRPLIDELREKVEAVPLLHAGAVPGGAVTPDTYRRLKQELLDRLAAEIGDARVNGIYLDLHGAMSVAGMHDAEGDLLAAVREIAGELPVSVSYDLHANLTKRVIESVDFLTGFRTAPHIDADQTRRRAIAALADMIRRGATPARAWVRVGALLPGELVMTTGEPAGSLYRSIPTRIRRHGLSDLSLLVGYAWADEPRSAAGVLAFADDPSAAAAAAASLAADLWERVPELVPGAPLLPVDECIRRAGRGAGPRFISDSGDNITAGAPGDRPEMLAALLEAGVFGALVAPIVDPETVAAAFGVGEGAGMTATIGHALSAPHARTAHDAPVSFPCRVERLATGDDGTRWALLRGNSVDVIVVDRRRPVTGLADLTRLDADPRAYQVVVVKLGYLFPELAAVAVDAVLASSPGVVPLDVTQLRFNHVRRPCYPLDEPGQMRPEPPFVAAGRTIPNRRS